MYITIGISRLINAPLAAPVSHEIVIIVSPDRSSGGRLGACEEITS